MIRIFFPKMLSIALTLAWWSVGDVLAQSRLTFHDFLDEVMQYHPAARMSDQVLKQTQEALLRTKGEFDPLITSTFEQKQFAQKQYYSFWQNSLQVPTRWGTQFTVGYDNNAGVFLNPQESLPKNGLYYVGIEQPLLKGLLYDERRAQLDLAINAIANGEQDRRVIRNTLYVHAAQAYFQWLMNYRLQETRRQGYLLALERLEFVRQRQRLGDLPAVDTLEALATSQNRQLDWAESVVELQKSLIALQAFRWDESGLPRDFSLLTEPDTLAVIFDQNNPHTGQNTRMEQQPELSLQHLKIAALEIDRRLSLEYIKPDLTLAYLPLRTASSEAAWFNDYKWKVGLKFPLLFRKGLGEKRSLEAKIVQEKWNLRDQENTFQAKLATAGMEISNWNQQVQLARNTVSLYDALLQAERTRLAAGESSLFLINARESAFLSAQEKVFHLQRKFNMAWIHYYFISGTPVW